MNYRIITIFPLSLIINLIKLNKTHFSTHNTYLSHKETHFSPSIIQNTNSFPSLLLSFSLSSSFLFSSLPSSLPPSPFPLLSSALHNKTQFYFFIVSLLRHSFPSFHWSTRNYTQSIISIVICHFLLFLHFLFYIFLFICLFFNSTWRLLLLFVCPPPFILSLPGLVALVAGQGFIPSDSKASNIRTPLPQDYVAYEDLPASYDPYSPLPPLYS